MPDYYYTPVIFKDVNIAGLPLNNSKVSNHFRECGKKGIFECAFALNYEQFVKYRKNRITLSFFYVYKGEECQMNGVDIF